MLFLEPFELVITDEIRTATAMALRDVDYDIGPFITLVDGPNFDFNWAELHHTVLNHIRGADMVFISRSDLIDEKALGSIGNKIASIIGSNHLLRMSIPLDKGIEEVLAKIR